MARTSPVHYIAPSSVSITPNANNTADDIAISVTAGAKIKVFCPRSGLSTVNDQYQEWTFAGRNRRLGDSGKPYTVYARLPKYDKAKGYLVFAPKNGSDQQGWTDKYNYITTEGLSSIAGATTDTANWYIRLGDVSLPENGQRTLTFDTGILGTDQFNTLWALNPDSMPLRVEFIATIDELDAGPTPYVYWGQTLVLSALLTEGWTGTDIQRFDHWEIARDTGNVQADAAWAATVNASSFRSTGIVNLQHGRGTGNADDFNGVVNTTFIVNAMERTDDPEQGGTPTYAVLKSGSICIMAETWEKYELSLAAQMVTYNPVTKTYSPSSGVTFNIRATDQKNDTVMMTNGQVASAGLQVQYAPVDVISEVWTPITISGAASAVAKGTVPPQAFTANQKSINVRLLNAANKELHRTTIAFLKDGEDSKEREWIFLRSATPITFGDASSEHPLPSLITVGQVNPPGAADGSTQYSNTLDGWVPQGWWDEQQGVTDTYLFEYGSYRDFVHENGSTPDHWGAFTTPTVWNHWGKDGLRGNFKSTVFKRTNTTPVAAPSGGDYDHPWPGGASGTSGWYDGIPDGEEMLWASSCTFHGDGTNSGWSTPKQMTDTADFDVEFSSVADTPGNPTDNPSNWSDIASSSTIWMATREYHNGVWSAWQVSKIKGEKGDSITKSSEVAYYIKNTTGVRPAEDDLNWSTTKPTIGKGEWLFTKIVITWSDNSKTVLYTDERNPNDGIAGQDIIVDGATEMKYYVGDSNTTHPAEDSSDWKDLSQVTQTQGKWLWSKATTWYRKASSAAGSKDAGHSVNYNVSYISKDGKMGRGIQSITEYYQATNSSDARQKPTSESGWDTDPSLSHRPSTEQWDANHKYLWNMEKTVYTNVDGSTTTEYTIPQILAIWTKDGNPGRGIDSIQNKYCVTSSSTPPAKEGEPGAPTWYNTPQTPGKGQYLWNYEVITWINPSGTTSTDVQMIGYAGTDGRTPQKGTDYFDGDNAVNVMLSPESIIVTQSTTSPYGIDLSNAETVVSVNEGGVPKSFTISNVSGTNCIASVKSGTTDTIKISDIGTYTETVDGEAVTRFYDSGYVTVNVTYNGQTYSKRFNFYANLLGTWKEEVVNDAKEEAASTAIWEMNDRGVPAKNSFDYTGVTSSKGEFDTFKSKYESGGASINNLNTRVSTAEGSIFTIQRNAVTRNLLGRGQWKSSYPGTLASYDAKNDRWYDDDVNDLYSPAILLQKGTYCFYCYVPSNRYFSSKICMYKLKDGSMIIVYPYYFGVIDNDTVTINGNVYHRCYAQFELNEDLNYVINVYGDSVDEADIAVPCLCEGDTPSIETSMSMIRQTADEIDASVRDDLGETGININGNNKTITLKGEHVVFQNSAGSLITPKISIDPNTGVLHAVDGDFSGSVSVGNGGLTCSVNNGKQTIVFEETAIRANEIWYGFAATSVVDGLYPGDILSLGGRINTTTGAGYGRLMLEEVTVGNTEPVVLYETELLPGGCIFRKDNTGKTLEFGFFDGYGDRLWIHAPKAQWREYSSGLRDGVVYVDNQYGILRVSGYNDSTLPWGGGGGGTVTSITAGTGLSGGTITGSGTISISPTYQTYISNGNTAYGWGNHANVGYLTSLPSHDHDSRYYISNGTIYLGSNSITPLSSAVLSNYLPLSGGAVTGNLAVSGEFNTFSLMQVNGTSNAHPFLRLHIPNVNWARLQMDTNGVIHVLDGGNGTSYNGFACGTLDINGYTTTNGNILYKGNSDFYIGKNNNGAVNTAYAHVRLGDECVFLQTGLHNNYVGLDGDGWFVCRFIDAFEIKDVCNNNKDILYYNYEDYGYILKSEVDFETSGDVTADSFIQGSDINRKNVISKLDLNIYNIANAPIFRFAWKDGKDTQAVHVGTAAQYWQKVLPETVTSGKDGTLAMQYDVVALAAAITTAKSVAIHEDRITILERENEALKKRIKELEDTIFNN